MQGGGFRLIVRRGPQPNQVYELSKDVITLGRDITNDIVINDPEVSRHHSRLTRTPGGYTLEDLGSTNGTFINGQRLAAARPLANGDMVGMGETVTMAYEGAAVPVVRQEPLPTVPQQPSPMDYPQKQGYQPPPYPQQPLYGEQPYAPQPYDAEVYPQQTESPPPQEQGSDALRYILLGCGVLVVLCVVMAVVAVIIIDTGNLWCDIPLGPTIVDVFGGGCPIN